MLLQGDLVVVNEIIYLLKKKRPGTSPRTLRLSLMFVSVCFTVAWWTSSESRLSRFTNRRRWRLVGSHLELRRFCLMRCSCS